MPPVDLDRRFIEWKGEPDADPEVWSRAFASSDRTLSWDGLRKHFRVVVLAEGGSGKSTEFRSQAGMLRLQGRFCWYANVLGVAQRGFEPSLRPLDRKLYQQWLASDREAWLFVDSVDEARLNRARLEDCLGHLADAIAGAERRAHILLSSRHTDWEAQADMARFIAQLAVPPPPPELGAPVSRDPLVRLLRQERKDDSRKEPDMERPLVVLLTALDKARVRLFAESRGVADAAGLLAALEKGGLWDFTRRPADLERLQDYWSRHGRLNTLATMLESSLAERLTERDPQRDRLSSLDAQRAWHALERIGAALVFGRATTLEIPDGEGTPVAADTALRADEVLPDYSGEERTQLLTRPAFDPGTFARTRLHNDNLGVVRAYLTARWLHRLRNANLSAREFNSLLFGEECGVRVVIPSMRETAAWLSMWDKDVARELIRREPLVLLTGGDPGSLSLQHRIAALTEVVRAVSNAEYTIPIEPCINDLQLFCGA